MIAAVQTKGCGRGKSGLHRAGCQITSGGGNSQDSATERHRVGMLAFPVHTQVCGVRVERQCKRLPCWW